MHVAVYHPEPARRVEFVNALKSLLPQGSEVNETPGPDTDYLVAWSPPRELFDQATGLKACFSLGAGVDHLLRSGSLPVDLPLYRLEDAGMGDQMARYCRHEVEHYRLLCWRFAEQKRQRIWQEHEPPEPADVHVGLFGYGVLGQQVAQMLRADGFAVSAFRRSAANTNDDIAMYSGEEQFDAFLGNCNVVVLIAPLTESTRGIVDSSFLDKMPAGSWLINVARGELIHDDDLLAAIESNHLVGASLDVFHTEPLPDAHPFWTNDKIRITPHVAALTRLKDTTEQITAKIEQLELGQQPSGLVLRDRGY